jgi:hypothetical protein
MRAFDSAEAETAKNTIATKADIDSIVTGLRSAIDSSHLTISKIESLRELSQADSGCFGANREGSMKPCPLQ